MASSSNGYVVEQEMCLALHYKKVSELTTHLRFILQELFGPLNPDEIIKCYETDSFSKPDISIYYKDQIKHVSIKTGACDVLHDEYIDTFVKFLAEHGVSEKTQKIFYLYQYGDGTLDGTGKVRLRGDQVSAKYHDLLEYAKAEINNNKDLIVEIVDRVMFSGVDPDVFAADAIYHGDVYSGTIVTKRQVIRHIRKIVGPLIERLISDLYFYIHTLDTLIEKQWMRKEDSTLMSNGQVY